MGTHPIFESDFDCLTDFRNGYIPGLSPQTSRYRWQTAPDSQEAQVRVWPTGVYDETGAAACSLGRTRGGNTKYRALRLDQGSFSWATEAISRKVRIIDVVYNASNNELVRTKTLVKGAIVTIDSTPFRQWYESHYATALGRKKNAKLTEEEEQAINGKKSASAQKKFDERKKTAEVSAQLVEQFQQGRLIARIASRPGQCGRADGYILEGKELEFYARKLKAKKTK